MTITCFDKAPEFNQVNIHNDPNEHQAVCACGWASDLLPLPEVTKTWVRHTENPRERRTEPATTKRFTPHTWESIGGTYGRDTCRSIGWDGQHDLAMDLRAAVGHWDYESAASAVEAAASHLPVRIEWTSATFDLAEVHDGFAIIDHILYSGAGEARLRLRYLGFAHYVPASRVRRIEQVGAQLSFENRQPAA